MGAVQKLATIVIVGLVGLTTLLVVYLANEPNRRTAEAEEQEEVAIERGTSTYLANCVSCHGPGGEGLSAGDGRIGYPLGGNTELGYQQQQLNQSEDASTREERYDLIVETLHQGRGAMPAFGRGAEGGALLNDEEIHELATMIQHVDWDVVYNEAIAEAGGAYPTTIPPAAPATAAQPTPAPMAGMEPAPAGGDGQAADQAPATTIAAFDMGWEVNGERSAPNQPIRVTVPPGATISLPNVGASPHNFVAESLDNVVVDMPVGQTVEYTVPADAAPGEYEFICNLPGHAQAGMVGVLVVDPNAAPPAGGGDAAAAPPAPGGEAPAAAGAAPPGAAPVTVAAVDIAWEYSGQRSAPGQPSRVEVSPGTVISLPNNGASPHNFVVESLGNVVVDLPVGATGEWTVPPDTAPGEYEFICSLPGHEQAGMVGTLIVQ